MATNIPPHNAGEICAALLHLIKHPESTTETLVGFMPGPDFPTGGQLCETRATVIDAYEKGRGSLRIRARWSVEELGRGVRQIVVTEIPYQVPKSRLVERIAALIEEKKLPILEDVRDESTTDVRLVLVPRSRLVEPAALMEALFKQTELEVRFGLNMNVLAADGTPRVMSLREVLQAFLDHRHVVLQRRSNFRLGQIARRLEILRGFLTVYLDLDKVIRIIRFGDEPKTELMAEFELTEIQADAILNMRLRSLHKLQELEIQKEHDTLLAEQGGLQALMADTPDGSKLRWKRIGEEIADIRKRFGEKTELGKRRTDIGDAPVAVELAPEAFVEREPITVLLSEKGWIRAAKGHLPPGSEAKYKEGDAELLRIHAQTTDKVLLFTSDGRAFTLAGDKLPSGRGMGEPVRLMIDMADGAQPVVMMVHKPGEVFVVASDAGRGFRAAADDVIAQTRAGRQVLNVADREKLARVVPVKGDRVAVIGENRRLLVFALDELPVMSRGRGVILQRYRQGGLADITVFEAEAGLSWDAGGRTRRETMAEWVAPRGTSGRAPPHGFPKSGRFE